MREHMWERELNSMGTGACLLLNKPMQNGRWGSESALPVCSIPQASHIEGNFHPSFWKSKAPA